MLTDQFESQVLVRPRLFGVFVQEHDGPSDAAVLQCLLAHAWQLWTETAPACHHGNLHPFPNQQLLCDTDVSMVTVCDSISSLLAEKVGQSVIGERNLTDILLQLVQ